MAQASGSDSLLAKMMEEARACAEAGKDPPVILCAVCSREQSVLSQRFYTDAGEVCCECFLKSVRAARAKQRKRGQQRS